MRDCFGRKVTYLRISVTDRCNFRCAYCMPEEGVVSLSHDEILRYEEIWRVARISIGLGVRSIRITGGEPLCRIGVEELVSGLSQLREEGLTDLAMTTNGSLLEHKASALKKAGLDRVNVSLDTLNSDEFSRITKLGRLRDTLAGIGAALRESLEPVKLNVVVTRSNVHEVAAFAYLAEKLPVQVRFIELMPLGGVTDPDIYVGADEMKTRLRADGWLYSTTQRIRGAGPARYAKWKSRAGYAAPDDAEHALGLIRRAWGYKECARGGSVGFITAMSDHFCASCNRLRLTADGKVSPCLWSDIEIDLKSALREAKNDAEIRDILVQAIGLKPKDHDAVTGRERRKMFRLGG